MDTWIDEEVRAREERIIRDTLAAYTRLDYIHHIQIEFGEDHSGHPAVWIRLFVTGTVRPPSAEWETIFEFSEMIDRELADKNLRHWPYIEFRSVLPATT